MTETLLDPRSRPTTEAERAKLYAKPDPTENQEFVMASAAMDCPQCARPIDVGEPVWLRVMPEDSPEHRLAQSDPDYPAGAPVLVPHCWACTDALLGEDVRDYAEERRQCEREERLEAACKAEADGTLAPIGWLDIAEANLGYCEPGELTPTIAKLIEDYGERYNCRKPESLEVVRAKLWGLVPAKALVGGSIELALVADCAPPTVEVEHHPGGRAVVRVAINTKVVAR
jgi:hypothetical protein